MTISDSTATAAASIMTSIRGYGIDTVFGIPGTHNLEFYRSMNELGIRAVTTRHEQGAGYAADGWSATTGHPGVVITTSGPGLLNVLSAAGTAYCESRPLLILSPGAPTGTEDSELGRLHEMKDATGAVDSVVHWSRRASSAAEAVELVHEAFRLFAHERPRPVHIEVPLDVLEASVRVDPALTAPRTWPEPPLPNQSELAAAARILSGAERPVLLAGGGARGASKAIVELAELLQIPVTTTINGKGTLPERHPLALGADLRLKRVRAVVESSDALLVVGSKVGEAELWDAVLSPSGDVIRIDIESGQMDKGVSASLALVGDSRSVVDALLSEVRRIGTVAADAPWLDVAEVRRHVRDETTEMSALSSQIAEIIERAIPSTAIVAGDSSQVVYLGATTLIASARPRQLLYMPTFATLGYGLPAAIGARVAAPDTPVVCLVGDGALMFSLQEFATARELNLDLTIVCVDNGGYGEIRQNMLDRGISPVGVDLVQPDWVALAGAFGATAFEATVGDLPDVFARALTTRGLNLVHVSAQS